jgi:hypothetical protein
MTPVPCYDPPEGLGTGRNPVPLMGDTENVNVVFFLQQRSHLQAKKLGEDGVGECHLI